MVILQGLEIALFTLFSIKVLYLFVFSVASRLRVAKQEERREHGMRRIVILIPAYKEDKVIMSVSSLVYAKIIPPPIMMRW